MKVLVTGGFGYIGGRLIRALTADPVFSVTATSRRERKPVGAIRVLVLDFANSSTADLVAACKGVDAIIHLAAMDEAQSRHRPDEARRVNVEGTRRLHAAGCSAGVRRFVYLSTSKVFGQNPAGFIDERTSTHPESPYAATHLEAEEPVRKGVADAGIGGIVLRISNSVGAPAEERPDTAWTLIGNDLCRQAAKGRIVLRSSGLSWRNFVAMSDVVTAIRHVLLLPTEQLGDGLFHVGGAESMKIVDLARMIAERAGQIISRAVSVETAAPVPGEPHAPLDWSVAKLMSTGWRPASDIKSEIDGAVRAVIEN